MRRLLAALTAAGLFSALLAVGIPAQAAKPAPTGTLAIDQSDVHYGDPVTFTITSQNVPSGASLTVKVGCFQSGEFVYRNDRTPGSVWIIDGQSLDETFTADCYATLVSVKVGPHSMRIDTLGTLTFEVSP